MTRISFSLGILAGLLMTPMAVAAPLPGLKGKTYDQARAQIIKLGFRPIRFVRTEDACILDRSCKRYPELVGCSPSRPTSCQFAFVEPTKRKYLVVTTHGMPRRVDDVAFPSQRERRAWPLIQPERSH